MNLPVMDLTVASLPTSLNSSFELQTLSGVECIDMAALFRQVDSNVHTEVNIDDDSHCEMDCSPMTGTQEKSTLTDFLRKSITDTEFKSFNTKKNLFELPLPPIQEYIKKKEWFLLSNFYKKVSHPTIFDFNLLSSVLGDAWTVSRIQNWFQHERSRKSNSKYEGTTLSVEDQTLWQEFKDIYCYGIDGQLQHQIQMAKQRAVMLLSNEKVQQLWKDHEYEIQGHSPAILHTLKELYDRTFQKKSSLHEEKDLSATFNCNLLEVPVQTIKELRRVTYKEVNIATSPKVINCNWEEDSICSCTPQNANHVRTVNLEDISTTHYYTRIQNSKFREDYIFVQQIKDLMNHKTFVDGVVLDSFLCHLNSIIEHPVYFLQTKFHSIWKNLDRNMVYLEKKLDRDMMINANYIYIPIHYHKCHWQTLEVNFIDNKFVLYKEESTDKVVAADFLHEYYCATNHTRKNIDFAKWDLSLCNEFPIQTTGTECGPFLIRAAMDFAYIEKPENRFKWTEKDTKYLRKLFASMIQRWRDGDNLTLKQVMSNLSNIQRQKIQNKHSHNAPTEHSQKDSDQQKHINNKEGIKLSPSPVKSKTTMAQILTAFNAETCDHILVSQLLQLPLIDLLRLSILSRILVADNDGQIHKDYQKQIKWLLRNIDNWPNCILKEIPDLKESYLTLVLQSDFCFPTGNIRTDLGMGVLCWTTRCCKSRNRCMLTLMDQLMKQQLEWKQSTVGERQTFVELKISRTVCIEEEGVFKFTKVRNHCTRAWQAVFGVHSARINAAISGPVPTKPKTDTWKQSVNQLSEIQIQQLDQHIEKTVLPNPFSPKGVKGNKFVLPPYITSIHQLYWDYVWHHIANCKGFKKNQSKNNSDLMFEKTKRKFRIDDSTVQFKKFKLNSSSKGFCSREKFIQSGVYRQVEKAEDLHQQFCSCVVHYSSWYKHYNAKWNDEVVAGAFAKTWCQTCQNFIDESTRWHRFKNNQTEKTMKSKKYFEQQSKWRNIKEEYLAHAEHAAQERKNHELLRLLAADGKLRLICFDFKTSLVCPYWGYHCAPNQVHYLSRMSAYFFGIVDEGDPDHFTGYIYPENFVDSEGPAATKKGAAHVIAMLYDFMDSNGLTNANRTTDRLLHFAADNCSGQNKNQYTLKFFCACVDLGWADDIKLDFMIPGHTKFGPDRWFGKIGKEIIKLDAWNIAQLIENVKKSVSYKETIKDFRDCQAKNFKHYLDQNYSKPKNFKVSEHYHFWFSNKYPGCVRVKTRNDDQWSDPIPLRHDEAVVTLDTAKLSNFLVIALTPQRINVMRQIKKMIGHMPDVQLDYESDWDKWEFENRVFEVKEILKSRQVNAVVQYKVKFKDDKYNNWSDDKYDEWLTEDQLEDAQKKLQAFKSSSKEKMTKSTIHRIRGYDPDRQKALVQWSSYPSEQDWTWEAIDDFTEHETSLLQPFILNFNQN